VAILRVRYEHRNTDYVFPGEGKSGYLQEPKKGWRRILQRAELYFLIDALAKAGQWTPKKCEAARIKAREDEAASLETYRAEAAKRKLDTTKARLTDLRIHDLRRTLGSWQAATGASLAVIGKSLGHKDMASTMVYARLDLDPVRQSMEKATSAILVAAGIQTSADVVQLLKGKSR
jgi:integrase